MFEENIGYSITVHDKNNMLACLRNFSSIFVIKKIHNLH